MYEIFVAHDSAV